MKIVYLSDADLPTRAAHGVHIMKMCEAFSHNHDVKLLTYKFDTHKKKASVDTIFDFYNVSQTFKIIRFRIIKFKGSKYFFSFLKACYAWLIQADVYYSRDFYTSLFLVNMGKQVVHEYHSPLRMKAGVLGWLTKRYLRKARKITVISNALKKKMVQEFNIPDNKVIVAHDASLTPTITDKIDLGPGIHVGYVGHLYAGKGMEIVGELANRMRNVKFHVVGGNEEDIKYWQEQYKFPNLTYHGFVMQAVLSKYINAFDICLLPNQRVVNIWNNSTINISDYTSPLKMFEYMAHEKAIIASDIEVLKEILNKNNAILCTPDHVEDWVQAIEYLLENPVKGKELAAKAYSDFMQEHTWSKRAEIVLRNIYA